METFDSLIYTFEDNKNSNLYEFLTTNYDISNLASKIYAEQNAPMSIINLRKIGTVRD